MGAVAALNDLRDRGYEVFLRAPAAANPEVPTAPVLVVEGSQDLPDDLRRRIGDHKTEIKRSLILGDPPPWLEDLADRFINGTRTVVHRTSAATGRAESYSVRVQAENVAAAVAAEIGASSYEEVLDEVLEFLDARTPKTKGAA